MKKFRITEFFEDSTRTFSMSRLLAFMAFFPAAYIVIKTNGQYISHFLGAFASAYGVGKGFDFAENVLKKQSGGDNQNGNDDE